MKLKKFMQKAKENYSIGVTDMLYKMPGLVLRISFVKNNQKG